MIKTRLQLQGELTKQGTYIRNYRGTLHGFVQVARHDGMQGLQKGLSAALGFQFVLNAFRYVIITLNDEMCGELDLNFFQKGWEYLTVPRRWDGPGLAVAIRNPCCGLFSGVVWVVSLDHVREVHFSWYVL